MKDWETFTKTESSGASNQTSVLKYILIKATDNFMIFLLILITFSTPFLALYYYSNDNIVKTWALHIGELGFGVFLGLFATKQKIK